MVDDDNSGDLRPRPDPTLLTTEQLHREIAALREFVLGEIRHVGDTQTILFEGVRREFEAVAQRTAEQKSDTGKALDAALQSARDAVALQTEAFAIATAKSEAATTKQIDALGTLVDKSSDAKDEKINDLKTRLDRLEAQKEGQETKTSTDSRTMSLMVAVGSLLVAIVVAGSIVLGSR